MTYAPPQMQLQEGYSASEFESDYESVEDALGEGVEAGLHGDQELTVDKILSTPTLPLTPTPEATHAVPEATHEAPGLDQGAAMVTEAMSAVIVEPPASAVALPAYVGPETQGLLGPVDSEVAVTEVETMDAAAEGQAVAVATAAIDSSKQLDAMDATPLVAMDATPLVDDELASPLSCTPPTDLHASALGLDDVIAQACAPDAASPEAQAAAVAEQLMHALVCEAVEAMRPKREPIAAPGDPPGAPADRLLPTTIGKGSAHVQVKGAVGWCAITFPMHVH